MWFIIQCLLPFSIQCSHVLVSVSDKTKERIPDVSHFMRHDNRSYVVQGEQQTHG